jgi:hypothetical protein
MVRFVVDIDELLALVSARATLAADGRQEFADTLGRMLTATALDDSGCE